MKYVVYTLVEDLDEENAEVNIIKILDSKEKAKELLQELVDETIENWEENEIDDYSMEDFNDIVVISNDCERVEIGFQEVEE